MGALRAQFRNRVANQVVRRLMYRRISVCFDKWRGIWQEKMRRRMKVRKCLIRITQSQANRALNAWRFYVAERSRRSGLASRAQIVSEVRRMHYSFKGWVDYVEHLAQMVHSRYRGIIFRAQNMRILKAFMTGGGGGFDFFTPDGGGGGGGGGRVDVFMTPGHELVQEGAVAY